LRPSDPIPTAAFNRMVYFVFQTDVRMDVKQRPRPTLSLRLAAHMAQPTLSSGEAAL
jgi:hypothetical protein